MRFAWHVHHNVLIEALTETLAQRVAYIKAKKPKSEQALRLKLLKAVRGNLPTKYVRAWEARAKAWKAYITTGEARAKAWKAYAKAVEAYDKAGKAYDKARRVYVKAQEAYDKAQEACDKAQEACENEINALHAKECPDCPWNGTTIFTGEE